MRRTCTPHRIRYTQPSHATGRTEASHLDPERPGHVSLRPQLDHVHSAEGLDRVALARLAALLANIRQLRAIMQ